MRRSIVKTFAASILCVASLACVGTRGAEYVETTNERVATACDDIIDRLIEWYGRPDDWDKFPVRFKQYRDNGVAGYTQYADDTVSEVVVYFPLDETIGGTLDHELTHAFLKFYLYRRGLDLFLNEGTAQTSELGRLNELRSAVYQQYARGEFWRLSQLVGRNRYDDRLRMYRQSYSVAEMLIRYGGRDYWGAFLREYVRSGDFDASLLKYYGFENVDALERRWLIYLNNGQNF